MASETKDKRRLDFSVNVVRRGKNNDLILSRCWGRESRNARRDARTRSNSRARSLFNVRDHESISRWKLSLRIKISICRIKDICTFRSRGPASEISQSQSIDVMTRVSPFRLVIVPKIPRCARYGSRRSRPVRTAPNDFMREERARYKTRASARG